MTQYLRFPLVAAALAALALGLTGCSKKEDNGANKANEEDKPRVEEKYGFTTETAGG